MRSFVNLEIFASCEDLSTAWKWTGKRLFPGVDTDVVDELVLGLERLQSSAAVLPIARMIALFRSTDVFNGDVRHDFVHRREDLVAWLQRIVCLCGIEPQTRQLLADRRCPDVAEEGSRTGNDVVHLVELRHRVVQRVWAQVMVVMMVVKAGGRVERIDGGAAWTWYGILIGAAAPGRLVDIPWQTHLTRRWDGRPEVAGPWTCCRQGLGRRVREAVKEQLGRGRVDGVRGTSRSEHAVGRRVGQGRDVVPWRWRREDEIARVASHMMRQIPVGLRGQLVATLVLHH